jgi:hypothetical protein
MEVADWHTYLVSNSVTHIPVTLHNSKCRLDLPTDPTERTKEIIRRARRDGGVKNPKPPLPRQPIRDNNRVRDPDFDFPTNYDNGGNPL